MQVGTVVVMGNDGGPPTTASDPSASPEPRATSLSEQEFRAATGAVEQRLDAVYDWDAGEAIAAFLDGLREQRILADVHLLRPDARPARKFCERCFRRPTGGPRSRTPAPSRRSRSATSRGTCRSRSRSSRP